MSEKDAFPRKIILVIKNFYHIKELRGKVFSRPKCENCLEGRKG